MTSICVVCGDYTEEACIYQGAYLVACHKHKNDQIAEALDK